MCDSFGYYEAVRLTKSGDYYVGDPLDGNLVCLQPGGYPQPRRRYSKKSSWTDTVLTKDF